MSTPLISDAVFPVEQIREDFPIFKAEIYGDKPLVYLDNAASSQKPQAMLDALNYFYKNCNSNVHRSVHVLAERATLCYEGARKKVQGYLNAPSDRCITFTSGTTAAINLVAYGWGRQNIKAGDQIMLSELEHHSNLVPWQMLCRDTGAELVCIPVTDAGTLDMDVFAERLTDRVKLVSVNHVSNALGITNPIEQIIAAAHAVGAKVLIDGAQSVPHCRIDVQALDCDFFAFSGHKMCGPTGIGALYGKEAILEKMEPYIGGGQMISKVEFHQSTWNELPYRFEAGTPNMADAYGLGAAVDYLEGIGIDAIHRYVNELGEYLLAQLKTVPGITIFAPNEPRGAGVSFLVDDIHPHDMAQCLDQEGIAVRAGHHCCQPLMKRFGVTGMTRASVYFYNTPNEIDQLIKSIMVTRKIFGHS
jgi:cysteine desulfurase/selenocysteine lyase